ncbi:MAG: hypothetical protein WDM70_03360 [Nitrosomonadales bacterium]
MTDQRHALQGLPEFHLHGSTQQTSRSQVVRTARIVGVVIIVLLLIGLGRALFATPGECG